MSDVTPDDMPADKPVKNSTKAKATGGPKTAKVKAAAPKAKVPATKASKAAPAKEPKAKKMSASQRFKDLIMEGGKTDDEIFEIVKGEFKLNDSSRSYVPWYRSWCKKNGMNPPERVVRDDSGKLVQATGKRLPVVKSAVTAAQKNAAKVAAAKAAGKKARASKKA